MKQRIITGFMLLLLCLPVIIFDGLFLLFQLLLLLISAIAAYEIIKIYDRDNKMNLLIKIIIIFCTIFIYLGTLSEWQNNGRFNLENKDILNIRVGLSPIVIGVFLILSSMTIFFKKFSIADLGKTFLIIFYVGIGFASVAILRYLGVRFIVYLFLITTLTDVFAYFCGYFFGKHKMSPNISPKKTWEGAIGGTIIATIIGTCFAIFYDPLFGKIIGPHVSTIFDGIINVKKVGLPITYLLIFLTTILISITSQIGDLFASRIKREYNVKDFGNCFPGHGGILDRLDSAIFSAAFLLLSFQVLNTFMQISNNF